MMHSLQVVQGENAGYGRWYIHNLQVVQGGKLAGASVTRLQAVVESGTLNGEGSVMWHISLLVVQGGNAGYGR